ncbi:MAG: YvcK family protein, partial [Rubrobacter sp.]|nr:YvcK family protein [Rubrobacter sp.]
VRNCLVALSGRRRLAEVFNYRFGAGDLSDHAVGNIIIAALADMGGGFAEGVEQAGRFLRTRGKVYPAAVESLTLVVDYEDGTTAHGETAATAAGKRISRVRVEPSDTPAPESVIQGIRDSDALVLSSGSLFTSTIPALLGGGVREALREFGGPVIYIANAMTQHGETKGFSVADHVQAIADHAGPIVTDVLVHGESLPEQTLRRYLDEGAEPVEIDRRRLAEQGVRLHESDLVFAGDSGVRHNPHRLADEVMRVGLLRR